MNIASLSLLWWSISSWVVYESKYGFGITWTIFDSYITHDDIDHQSNDNEAIFIWYFFTNIAYYNNHQIVHIYMFPSNWCPNIHVMKSLISNVSWYHNNLNERNICYIILSYVLEIQRTYISTLSKWKIRSTLNHFISPCMYPGVTCKLAIKQIAWWDIRVGKSQLSKTNP